MKILIAPDSYKGSLTASDICSIVAEAAREADPDCSVTCLPSADGGEGTLASVLAAVPGTEVRVTVRDPLQRPVTARYLLLEDGTAVLEMAEASGLTLLSDSEREVLSLNTFGTGEMILDAVRRGSRKVCVGIGGSATNDGGIGMAAALGARFLDAAGEPLPPFPSSFKYIRSVDLTGIPASIRETEFTILCDVRNVLLGPDGATAVYGPQKGVRPDQIAPLDAAMRHYISCVETAAGRRIRDIPGSGAAGGLGAALLALTRAEIRPGAETLLDLIRFEEHLRNADLVITGEGRMDRQSAYGKIPAAVAGRCLAAGVPCVAIVGSMGSGAEVMLEHGLTRIVPIAQDLPLEEALRRAPELCREAALRLFHEIL